jgi:hypothetical protein
MEVCLPRRCPGTLINNTRHQIQIPFFAKKIQMPSSAHPLALLLHCYVPNLFYSWDNGIRSFIVKVWK